MADPVYPIERRVELGILAEEREELAGADTTSYGIVLGPILHVSDTSMGRDTLTYHPMSNNINVLRPSGSQMDDIEAWIASSTADFSSSSSSISLLSYALTRAFRTTVRRRLRAFPATVTRDAIARALNADIGMAVSVGRRIGNTVDART